MAYVIQTYYEESKILTTFKNKAKAFKEISSLWKVVLGLRSLFSSDWVYFGGHSWERLLFVYLFLFYFVFYAMIEFKKNLKLIKKGYISQNVSHKVLHWHHCKPPGEKAMGFLLYFLPDPSSLETLRLVSVIAIFCWERGSGLGGLWALVFRRRLTCVSNPQGKLHLCLGICLVHLLSVTDFCLGTRDQNSPGIPLTFLRDYSFNSIVQEYPFLC